ncbi:putative hydrolase [Hartmannibacter diazotrophicus]|uniref:Putative hydrolase n=1 Tax=Hartmannibacter diazotrophicus TaxID=1482074 RepID=A0A2C9DEC8_9HYPH|nr:esterase [Hartmannibacter diazotrophicus]SON58381.1 putative hydrolase [Hartmannibacter diazotrophicus]
MMDFTNLDLSFLDPVLLGRLAFTHKAPTKPPLPPGRNSLGLSEKRDAILYVPEGIDPATPTPLLVLFHGAGGGAGIMLPNYEPHADARKFLILAPQSIYPTWDLVIAGNGPDRERLDTALTIVADHFTLDPAHLAFAGWSDGCSYALSIGLTNGRIVSHIIAMSGGFLAVTAPEGEPKIFISHGRHDEQLPVEVAGRGKAEQLKQADYDVTYVEHDGPHKIRADVVEQAVGFFLD